MLRDKDGKWVRGSVSVCFWVHWGAEGGCSSFLEMHFCVFFFHSCSLHISTDIKRHQIARNSPWLCMAAKRVAGILPSQRVRVEIRDKMPFEVDYSWEGSRSSFTHITRCGSPPFCSRLHWGEEAELFWVSHQPPRATLIFTSMQIQDVMVSLPRSPQKQRYISAPRSDWSVVLYQNCKYAHWQFYYTPRH